MTSERQRATEGVSRSKARPSAFADVVAGVLSIVLFVVNIVVDVAEPIWVTITGLMCLGLAVPFAVLPFFHLSEYGKPKSGDAFFATTRVADEGIYSLVRHPQYLGYMLLVVGFAGIDPHPVALGLMVAAVAFFYMQCVSEERFCHEVFGENYGRYAKRVPRINVLLGLYRSVRRIHAKP